LGIIDGYDGLIRKRGTSNQSDTGTGSAVTGLQRKKKKMCGTQRVVNKAVLYSKES
jgi:hypothetical protein